MEQDLEALIRSSGSDEDIEAAILFNIMRENAQEPPQYFNLEDVDNNDCTSLFRFEKNDLYQLCEALRVPEFITTYNQNKVSGLTGLCMLLRRLVYPNRLSDLQGLFGYSPRTISMVTRHVTDILMQNHGHLLSNLEQLPWLNHQRLELYAQAIHNKGAPMHNCWGFIDGTARAIFRPTVSQEDYYSGHKRCHCVKYQSVLCPDGIIASLKGGWPGRRHDAAMFTESNLYNELERVAVFPNEDKYILYADQAYGIRELLWTPYTNRINIEPHQQEFNNLMRRLRLTVEWGFQKTITKFAFLDFKKIKNFYSRM